MGEERSDLHCSVLSAFLSTNRIDAPRSDCKCRDQVPPCRHELPQAGDDQQRDDIENANFFHGPAALDLKFCFCEVEYGVSFESVCAPQFCGVDNGIEGDVSHHDPRAVSHPSFVGQVLRATRSGRTSLHNPIFVVRA